MGKMVKGITEGCNGNVKAPAVTSFTLQNFQPHSEVES